MPIIRLENFPTFQAVNVLRDPGNPGGPKIVPSCAQVSMRFLLESGKTGHVVLWGRYSGTFAGTQAQANAITTALVTSGTMAPLLAFWATASAFAGIDIRDMNTANQPLIQSNAAGASGTSASPSLPNEVAAVVTLRTALAGRANRGRAYIPGWATNALGAGNVIAGGALTALANWAATWIGIYAAQGYQLVIGQPHRIAYVGSTGTQHPDRPATSTPVVATLVRDNHWDSQRRRGLK